MSVSALIIIVLFSMFALSIYFWYLEAKPAINSYQSQKSKLKRLEEDDNPLITLINMCINTTSLIFIFLTLLPKLVPLIIDITITVALTTVLSLGGNIGGAAGLFASNIISLIIILISQGDKK